MKSKDQTLLEEAYKRVQENVPAPAAPAPAAPAPAAGADPDQQKQLQYLTSTLQFLTSAPRMPAANEIQKIATTLGGMYQQTTSEPLKARLGPFVKFIMSSLNGPAQQQPNSRFGQPGQGMNPALMFVVGKLKEELPELIKIIKTAS